MIIKVFLDIKDGLLLKQIKVQRIPESGSALYLVDEDKDFGGFKANKFVVTRSQSSYRNSQPGRYEVYVLPY